MLILVQNFLCREHPETHFLLSIILKLATAMPLLNIYLFSNYTFNIQTKIKHEKLFINSFASLCRYFNAY